MLVCLRASSNLLVEFSFDFFCVYGGNCLILFLMFVLSDPVPASFESPFFRQYLCIVRVCLLLFSLFFLFVFSAKINSFVCFSFLSTFAYCRTFFIGPVSLISYWDLMFLFGFLRGIPVLSETSFAPAWISSFSSVMLLAGLVGWLVVLFYGVSTFSWSFNAELSDFDWSFKQFSFVPDH